MEAAVANPVAGSSSTMLPSAGIPQGSPSVHLDALRGFAALSVLLNHWRDALFVDYSALPHHGLMTAAVYLATGLGHQWVIIFFVMSGYLVGGSVLRSTTTGRWSWRGYMVARLTRLYIVLLPALLLGGLIDQAGMHISGTENVYSGKSGMHALIVDVHTTSRPVVLLENGLFLQTLRLPGTHDQVPMFGSNGPLWSLCNEFWYYMGFPLIVLLLQARQSWLTRIGCGLGLLIWGWFVGLGVLLLGVTWLMGALISFLPRIRTNNSLQRGLMILSALALLLGGLVFGKFSQDSLPSDLSLGVLVTFLIWVTLGCATARVPRMYSWTARRAARSSYTLYLAHLPLLIFLKATLHLPRSIPTGHSVLVGLATLLGILVYAQGVYQLFERNTERVRSWVMPLVSTS